MSIHLWIFRERTNRDPTATLKSTFGTLRELELHLKFFNLVYADGLWVYKVLALVLTIFCGSSAIRLIHTNPILGGLYAYLGLATCICFIGIYRFAYAITEKFQDLKRLMEIISGSLVRPEEKKYWKMVLRSVPSSRMGLSLGGFHQVERQAVPIFMDFVVKQIVGLLP